MQMLIAAGDVPHDGLAGWAVGLMEQLGLVGVGIAVALDNFFPPLPSEIVLPLAGFTASRGEFSLIGALVATTLGSVLGALVLYYVGFIFGRDRVRAVIDKMPLVSLNDVDRTEAWFARHGTKAVFFGRMVPIFRSVISIPAGVERMPVLTFTVLTTTGSLIWNSIFVVAGYQLGENWAAVEPYAEGFQRIVIVAVVVAVVAFVVVRLRSRARD